MLMLGILPAFSTVIHAADDYNIYVGNIKIGNGKYLLQGASSTISFSELPEGFDFDKESYAYVWERNLFLTNFTYSGSGYGDRDVVLRLCRRLSPLLSQKRSSCRRYARANSWQNLYGLYDH